MNFFEHQERARRKTGRLIVMYGFAVVAIVFALYFSAVGLVYAATHEEGRSGRFVLWDRDIFVGVAGFTVLVVLMGSIYRVSSLSGGGEAIATALGGRLLPSATKNANERKLLNVIEEMSIASGCRVPRVYIMEDGSINAFAAGFSPQEAVIGVTRGSIERLSRDELQGVIAHEFSHIFNGDMALNIRLIGILYGITMLSSIGYWTLRLFGESRPSRSSSRDGKGGGGLLLAVIGFAFALLAIGAIGAFFARLIQAAVSRQREFLADASAVQFTRNPRGIAGAFRRMMDTGTAVSSPGAAEASHMFFGDGVKRLLDGGPWASHPPLRTRIDRVLGGEAKAFLGEWKEKKPPSAPTAEVAAASAERQKSRLADLARGVAVSALVEGGEGAPERMLSRVGELDAETTRRAEALVASLPSSFREAAGSPHSACAVIYLLLLDGDADVRSSQLEYLRAGIHAAVGGEIERLLPASTALRPYHKLPLIDLAMPALRELSREQYDEFAGHVEHLVRADRQISLFEYSLERMLARRVGAPPKGRRHADFHSIGAIEKETVLLLSALAHMAHHEKKRVEQSFEAGRANLQITSKLAPIEECTYKNMDAAIDKVERCSAGVKQRLLMAFMSAVLADKKVTVEEAEMLRAFADSLDCPVPLYPEAW